MADEKPIAPDIPMDVADWGDNVVKFPKLGDLTDEELEAAEARSKLLWGDDYDKRVPSMRPD